MVETAADTRTCVTLLEGPAAGPARQVTELVEPAAAASGAEQERFAAAYEELLGNAAAVVIAGTAIGGAHPEVYAEMVRLAHRRGVPTLLDAYRDHARAALAAAPEILKINRAELAELAADRAAFCRRLRDRHGVQWVLFCCSYVDRGSGRRCGSRNLLEIDHVVPYAHGGQRRARQSPAAVRRPSPLPPCAARGRAPVT